MSKIKLIEQLGKKNNQLNKFELEYVIDSFLKDISSALKNKINVEIRGFGRFYCKELKENFNLRNPSTNEKIYRPARFKIRFKASKKLNKIINE